MSMQQRPKSNRGAGALVRTTWHGEYMGSCYISAAVDGKQTARDATSQLSTFGTLRTPTGSAPTGHGKRRIVVALKDSGLVVTDAVTQETMQHVHFNNIISVDIESTKIVFSSRSLDERLSIKIAHVISVASGASLVNGLRKRIKGLKGIPDTVCMVTDNTPDVSVMMACYLGFVKVPKSKGSSVVQTAIKCNNEKRALLERRRRERRLPKSSLLAGVSKSDDMGTHVSEYPVAIVMSGRSIRFIDLLTGETISKFFLKQITFQGPVVYRSKPDVYGMIMHNARLNQSNCHLFTVHAGGGKVLHKMLANSLKLLESELGKSGKKVEKSVFSALEGYTREKPPADLYRKQIRRGHLIPDKVLGAGEYGEVYLATQKNVLDRVSNKVTTKQRAVKLLKAGADKSAREEFIRECQMLMICEGTGIVRMIGVAVQQAPWLCVLQYMEYGDLRTFLKGAKSKHISLTTGEELRFCEQLASGCNFISKARVVHMDLAARNVLLGHNNEVKIADFGMSRPMDKGTRQVKFENPIRVAIKWTAMEAMMENTFSETSDCWSLGIVFWEICTMGAMPYAHVSNVDMLYYLIGGDRVMAPIECPDDFWQIMLKCWEEEPSDRWKFSELITALHDLCSKYPVTKPRDIGKYVAESKGEKPASPEPMSGDEPKYVYDVPLPNEEDGYDIPVDTPVVQQDTGKEEKAPNDNDDEYDIPIGDGKVDETSQDTTDNAQSDSNSGSDAQQVEADVVEDSIVVSASDGPDNDAGDTAGDVDATDDTDDAGDTSELRSRSEVLGNELEQEEIKLLERKQSMSAHKTLPKQPSGAGLGKQLEAFMEEDELESDEDEANIAADAHDSDASHKDDDLKVEEVVLGGEFDDDGADFGFGDADADLEDGETVHADATTSDNVETEPTLERRNSIYDGFDGDDSSGSSLRAKAKASKKEKKKEKKKEMSADNHPASHTVTPPMDRQAIEDVFLNSLKRGSSIGVSGGTDSLSDDLDGC